MDYSGEMSVTIIKFIIDQYFEKCTTKIKTQRITTPRKSLPVLSDFRGTM